MSESRDDRDEATQGQHSPVHDPPPASPGNHDSNERADDAVTVENPDGTPVEKAE